MINAAGAFRKSHILVPFIVGHGLQKEFCVYDGVDHPWAGGRIQSLISTKFNEHLLKLYNRIGIPVFLTFSNPVIDLKDTDGRTMLNKLDYIGNKNNVRNGVILVNEDFRQFLREKYPNLILKYSITGHSNDCRDFDISLESKYDIVVPRFENVFNEDFLKVADTSKYEVMVNDTCRFGCKLWNDHFREIARCNITKINDEEARKIQECWLPNFNPEINSKSECMDMTKEAIKKAKSLGYGHFKISGRENSDSSFSYDLNTYVERILS